MKEDDTAHFIIGVKGCEGEIYSVGMNNHLAARREGSKRMRVMTLVACVRLPAVRFLALFKSRLHPHRPKS